MSIYELYYGKVLKVYVYGEDSLQAVSRCKAVVTEEGHELVENPAAADIAFAPLLERRLSREEYTAPRLGTLVFHPSLLPMYRGRDAIKRAYRAGDTYTGVTWFWCSDQLDAGDICEQSVVPLDRSRRPLEFYLSMVMDAMVALLRWLLRDLSQGYIRTRPQRALDFK